MTDDNIIELTDDERAIIIGTLLGDAHLQKRSNSYRFKIEHGIKQKKYVWWSYEKLKRLCDTTLPPKTVFSARRKAVSLVKNNTEVDENTDTTNATVVFYLKSGSYLAEIHALFYKQNDEGKYVKRVTPELIEKLPMNPLLLTTWFLDDGSVRNDCYAGKLAIQGFTKEENELLSGYLKRWNIIAKVNVSNLEKQQYYLAISAKTFGNLVSVIETILRTEIPSMVYKLNDERKKKRKPRND